MARAHDIAEPSGGKPRARVGWLAPLTIFGFIALVLAGTYYVRLLLLERAVSSALEMGDARAIEGLLDSWPCPVNGRGSPDAMPLHWAAANGRSDLVARCLAKGADVNALGKPGAPDTPNICPATALFWAASRRRGDIVRLLVANGADPDIAGEQDLPLLRAAENGDNDMVALLLTLGANPAAKGPGGETAMRSAARRQDERVVAILRAHGVTE